MSTFAVRLSWSKVKPQNKLLLFGERNLHTRHRFTGADSNHLFKRLKCEIAEKSSFASNSYFNEIEFMRPVTGVWASYFISVYCVLTPHGFSPPTYRCIIADCGFAFTWIFIPSPEFLSTNKSIYGLNYWAMSKNGELSLSRKKYED